jgi:hypothetical protein
VAYGLTATLYGECKVNDGRMVDLNFDKPTGTSTKR